MGNSSTSTSELRDPASESHSLTKCTHVWQPLGDPGKRRFACTGCASEITRDERGKIDMFSDGSCRLPPRDAELAPTRGGER